MPLDYGFSTSLTVFSQPGQIIIWFRHPLYSNVLSSSAQLSIMSMSAGPNIVYKMVLANISVKAGLVFEVKFVTSM